MRILVVEDECDLRRAISQGLIEEGFAVDEAPDGEKGLEKALMWEYDVIVLDLMLPIKNGWDVLRELRNGNDTPVLILTARDAISEKVHGLNSGADDYLTKPFSIAELVARIRALIRRSKGQASPLIEIGTVCVNTANRTVTKGGQSVQLTAREYAIVEMLSLHRGELITRTMIYDHIFGEDDSTLSNLVDVHMSNIRKKLGADFVTTRRGQGYIVDG